MTGCSLSRVFMAGIIVLGLSWFNGARAGDNLVDSKLSPCLSEKVVLGGVNSCGKVWKLGAGQARVDKDGSVNVELTGLVLNDTSVGEFNGTRDGVDAIAIALVCDGKVASQTEPVTLSQKGNATVNAKLTVPQTCGAPTVLVRERYEGKIGGWLASTGTAGK